MKVFISLKDKHSKRETQPINIEELIYDQNSIEFEFGNFDDEDYCTLPYKDFLFFQDDYEVIVKVNNND